MLYQRPSDADDADVRHPAHGVLCTTIVILLQIWANKDW